MHFCQDDRIFSRRKGRLIHVILCFCWCTEDDGKEIQIICSWSPVNVWVNLPEYSPESNDSIILQNHGDADMPWVVDMIDNNASFETDPFYAAHIFVPDTLNASEDVAIFNISVYNSVL